MARWTITTMTLQAHLDRFTESSLFEGWARGASARFPCQVGIFWNGECVARAIADRFRRDLLQARIGHGHYSFQARSLTDLPPGEHAIVLRSENGDGSSTDLGEFQITVPVDRHRKSRTHIEELIRPLPAWTIDDVRQHVGSLRLDLSLLAMGARRFIDVSYMFVFNRWADPGAVPRFERALVSGEMSPEQFLVTLLSHDHQRPGSDSLPSPYEARYPFLFPPAD
ncbi:hypothetical protein [Microvirga sp. VF16]|uniref:hypothetical protein n=1 Tax=Microvirga sp. VF16 TaxID=2807101 RepID=UPI00193E3993|nr:hypothetical protein [Microvirga sp. VF16]QRM35616.1 hypothetical protein JO965_43085 [Microvirga sp. VF16]